MQTKKLTKKYLSLGIILTVLLVLILVFKVKIVTTLAISFLAGIIQFLAGKYQIKIDTGHVFFLGVLLARVSNSWTIIAFIILAGILPKILAGDIDPVIIIAYIIQSIVIFASQFFSLPIILYGVALSIITFGAIFICVLLLEFSIAEVLDDTVSPLILNLIYFVSFSEFLLGILRGLYG